MPQHPSTIGLVRARAVCCLLAVAACLPCLGCLSSHGVKRWLDPLHLTRKPELSEEPDFRKRVGNDPFPAASQVGLAAPRKTEGS